MLRDDAKEDRKEAWLLLDGKPPSGLLIEEFARQCCSSLEEEILLLANREER